jgi:hypothetical protein
MTYTESAISAAKTAAVAWQHATSAMANAKIAETLQNPANIAIVAKAAEIDADRALEAYKACQDCYEPPCHDRDAYEAIDRATAAASDAEDVARDAALFAAALLKERS